MKKAVKKSAFKKSVWFAVRGIAHALSEERNIKFQFAAAIIAILAAFFLNISRTNLMIVIMVCFIVIILELINTAFEKLIDKLHPKRDDEIGRVKDIMAGAVLLSVILAIIIGVLVLARPVYSLVQSLF